MGRRGEGMRLVIVSVPSRPVGLEALVSRDADGSVTLHQTRDAGAGTGAMRGGLVGLAVGIIAAPAVVLAAAAGAGVGAIAAKWRDHGIDDAMLERLGDLLEGREAALVVLADEASADLLTARVDDLVDGGADLDDEVVPPEGQELIRTAIEQGLGTG